MFKASYWKVRSISTYPIEPIGCNDGIKGPGAIPPRDEDSVIVGEITTEAGDKFDGPFQI